MAKSVLLDVLEKTIGKYVINLDTNSLNVALWSGKIELHSLQLNAEAVNAELAQFQPPVPFRVQSGHFTQFQLDVPWANLYSKPVVVTAKGLHVHMIPSTGASHHETQKKNKQTPKDASSAARIKAITHADEYRLQANALRQLAQLELESVNNESQSFGKKLVRRIMENMQVVIGDVHFSLENGGESTAGVLLESLQLVTTDAFGKRTFVDRSTESSNNDFLYKKLQVRGLGIYLDDKEDTSTGQKRQGGGQEEDGDTLVDGSNHDFILAPLSFEATLRQADAQTASADQATYLFQSELSSLHILLSKTQVELANRISTLLHPPDNNAANRFKPLFPEYRPHQSLGAGNKEVVREWWHYAMLSVQRLSGRRSWIEFLHAFQKRKRYIALYKRKVYARKTKRKEEQSGERSSKGKNKVEPCHWLRPLSANERADLQALELDPAISVEGLMMWRSIADAQVEREREKHDTIKAGKPRTGLFTSLFGSNSASADSSGGQEQPPVTLSAQELADLEKAMALQHEEYVALASSKKRKLYDLQFVLESLQVHLVSYHLTPLALLKMGTVSATLQAHADGAYQFDFCLSSLAVEDKITPNSLFPTVLQNQMSRQQQARAFTLHLKKTMPTGDQQLKVQLSTFEAVASPQLLSEVNRFVTLGDSGRDSTPDTGRRDREDVNPVLAQSLSGSVDLFYDANHGPLPSSSRQLSTISVAASSQAQHIGNGEQQNTELSGNISNALLDAWKLRTQRRSSWLMDLDLNAPVLVVPQNCVDPSANVMVLNLGHLKCHYENSAGETDNDAMDSTSKQVKAWFLANPRTSAANEREPVLDYGHVEVGPVSFLMGQTKDWRKLVQYHSRAGGTVVEDFALLQPFSLTMDLGVEAAAVPRVCCFAVLPAIVLSLSPDRLAQVVAVYQSWYELWKQEFGPGTAENVSSADDVSVSSRGSRLLDSTVIRSALLAPQVDESDGTNYREHKCKQFHANVKFQRLSLKVTSIDGGMEAHIVSVCSSITLLSNGHLQAQLRMGWFWILDMFHNDFPRVQRLLAHSLLPTASEDAPSSHDILSALEGRGVFTPTYNGSSDLAEVFLIHSPYKLGELDPYSDHSLKTTGIDAHTVVEANLSGFFVNWNPKAIKRMLEGISECTKFFDEALEPERKSIVILQAAADLIPDNRSLPGESKHEGEAENARTVVVRAHMESVEVCLRSALDDFPIFNLTMSSANASYVASAKEGVLLRASLGDLTIATPNMGRTHRDYRVILGLIPGKSSSLFSVCYVEGKRAMATAEAEGLNTNSSVGDLAACALATISPVRMVYIQAQVLALAEYATEGILGALASQTASSAAMAAAEMVASASARKVFSVRATGLDILLPEKATEKKHFTIKTDSLGADYTALSAGEKGGGGIAKLLILDVMVEDFERNEMLNDPIRIGLDLVLPPLGIGSHEDQAYRVQVEVSSAAFLLLKRQYDQMLSTLNKNMGELQLFLRDDDGVPDLKDNLLVSLSDTVPNNLTHVVENTRSMYVAMSIDTLSLDLLGDTLNDGIVRIRAVRLTAAIALKPHEEALCTKVSFRDLVCADERPISVGRAERMLISQADIPPDHGPQQRLVEVSYENARNGRTDVVLEVGCPRLAFIPDAVSELLEFFSFDGDRDEVGVAESKNSQTTDACGKSEVRVAASESDDGFEIEAIQIHSMSLSLSTGQCSVVLVDLGGSALVGQAGSLQSMSVAETIVLRGSFDLKASLESHISSGEIIGVESQLHGNAVEIYTALVGQTTAPVQILDPFHYTVFAFCRGMDTTARSIDVRVAVIAPIDVCFSMQNFALLNAIIDGIAEDLWIEEESDGASILPLTSQDAHLIENLDDALKATDKAFGTVTTSASTSLVKAPTDVILQPTVEVTTSIKITLPDAKLTIVNDLQGLDDALIRVELCNLVSNLQVRDGQQLVSGKAPYTGFDANLNCSILADYFDGSESLWKTLLQKPGEITVGAGRGPNKKFTPDRLSTSIDIESFPCHISFSEEFLLSMASANRMWTVYKLSLLSVAASIVDKPPMRATGNISESMTRLPGTESVGSSGAAPQQAVSVRRSIAATAARTIITVLPYALENNCGMDVEFKVLGVDDKLRLCSNGSVEYFRFPQPKSKGTGGKRLYGQDVTFDKTVSIRVGGSNSWIEVANVDGELKGQRQHHMLQEHLVLFTQVLKEGKTTVVHISSGVDIHGRTSVPLFVSMLSDEKSGVLGVCSSASATLQLHPELSILQDRGFTKQSSKFGIPVQSVREQREKWSRQGTMKVALCLEPNVPQLDHNFKGEVEISLDRNAVYGSDAKLVLCSETVCRPVAREGGAKATLGSFVVQVRVVCRLVDERHPCLDIFLEPRAVIENKLPIPVSIRTLMPQTYSARSSLDGKGTTTHEVEPSKFVEIFTSGPSVAVGMRCSENPVVGAPTGWTDGDWIDLPLTPGYRLAEPLRCFFPFASYSGNQDDIPGGVEFFIADGSDILADLHLWADKHREGGKDVELASMSTADYVRTFTVAVCNYSVDHTGEMLFGVVEEAQVRRSAPKKSTRRRDSILESTSLGAYRSRTHHGRVSLLPSSGEKIQLVHLTMDGVRKSEPFRIEDVSISEGGVNSTPIFWEDRSASGFFVYQKLVNAFQSEIHVVPEFVVYNGSLKYGVRVKQQGGTDVVIRPGRIAPLQTSAQQKATVSVQWSEHSWATSSLSVDKLGLRVAIVRNELGTPIGSLAIQTVVGSQDSRLVVKLAEVRLGSEARQTLSPEKNISLLDEDFLRFRVQWSEFKVTLNEARPIVGKNKAYLESALDQIATQQGVDPSTRFNAGKTSQKGKTWMEEREHRPLGNAGESGGDAVCSLVLRQVTVDWQRVFKEDNKRAQHRPERQRLQSLERSQLSVIVHNIRVTDETPGSNTPLVLDSTTDISFFDLCIRVKGPLDAELVNVELFDLNLAHLKGKSERIIVSTSESFAWKLLDLGDRIVAAASEFCGVQLDLEWDEAHGGYKVLVRDATSFIESESKYTPPNSEKLYDIALARVSPFTLLASFERTPVTSRYQRARLGQGAALMNYFTQRLKFKIDRAELKFDTYEAKHIKGPADRIIEIISTVYLSRMKLKLVTLMTAVSFQDWKFLADRSGGDDEFTDGDLVRAAGNLAGNTANYIFKQSGGGIGSAFKRGSSSLGHGIESVAGKIGAESVGASVNSVVSGVGGGIGEAASGVGAGAGKVVKGIAGGAGAAVGGVTGGASMIVKGSAKGLATGDSKAVGAGMVEGAKSVGTGVGHGVSSVVMGSADGVYSVGKGLFSGVRSVGLGVVGAVGMKKQSADESSSKKKRSGAPETCARSDTDQKSDDADEDKQTEQK